MNYLGDATSVDVVERKNEGGGGEGEEAQGGGVGELAMTAGRLGHGAGKHSMGGLRLGVNLRER